MKRQRPEVRRVPPDYRPRYPDGLTPEQYRELMAAEARTRILQVAATASIAFGVAVPAQGESGEREESALRVLSGMSVDPGFWFDKTAFVRSRNAFDSPVVVPNIPISYGNSHNGVFDAERARKLALAMFEAYGLKPQADRVLRDDGVVAVLDGYDGDAKIGFKLRGDVPEKNGMFAEPEPEGLRTDLDEGEHAALTSRGLRIHVADLADYPLMDSDQFTPTMAYLAGIVDFLNTVTDGPDLDMEAILMSRAQRFPLPAEPDLPSTVTQRPAEDGIHLHVVSKSLVPLRIDPRLSVEVRSGPGQSWVEAAAPLTTAGRPTMLQLGVQARSEGARLAVRLSQRGARPVQIDGAGPTVFLPSAFDGSRPFVLTLELEKGDYRIGPHVVVGIGH